MPSSGSGQSSSCPGRPFLLRAALTGPDKPTAQGSGQRWPEARLRRSDVYCAVLVNGPVRVVGHFPHISVGVGERSCCSAPLSACCRANDGASGVLGFGEQGIDVLG